MEPPVGGAPRKGQGEVIDLTEESTVPAPAPAQKKGPKPRKAAPPEKENAPAADDSDDGNDFEEIVKQPVVKKVQSKLVKGKKGAMAVARGTGPGSGSGHAADSSSAKAAAAASTSANSAAAAVAESEQRNSHADYVLGATSTLSGHLGHFDEHDLKMNKLRVELRDIATQRSQLEARERKIRKDIKAVEKKQNESLTRRSLPDFFKPGEDQYSEAEIESLFGSGVNCLQPGSALDQQQIAEGIAERKQLRESRPLFELASMHSQADGLIEDRGTCLEMHHCFLLPLAKTNEDVTIGVGGGGGGGGSISGADLAAIASTVRGSQPDMSVFTQLLMVMDEASGLATENDESMNEAGFVDMQQGQQEQHEQQQEGQKLQYDSRCLDGVFNQRNGASDNSENVFVAASSSDRANHWIEEQARFARLVHGYMNSSQVLSQSQELRDGLSKFATLWTDMFSSVTLAQLADDETPTLDVASAAVRLGSVQGNLQQILLQNQVVVGELQTNLEAMLKNLASRGADEEEIKFLQGLLASCFTSRVLSDAALFGNRQSSDALRLLQKHRCPDAKTTYRRKGSSPRCAESMASAPLDSPSQLQPHQQSQQSQQSRQQEQHPPERDGSEHHTRSSASPYNGNPWGDFDGIIYGGSSNPCSFYDPDDYNEPERGAAATTTAAAAAAGAAAAGARHGAAAGSALPATKAGAGAGAGAGIGAEDPDGAIDLITPDSQPVAPPIHREMVLNSSLKKPAAAAAGPFQPGDAITYFCEESYASGICPDFASLSQSTFDLNCEEVGLPTNLRRPTAVSMLISVWKDCRQDWLNSPGKKNKRDDAGAAGRGGGGGGGKEKPKAKKAKGPDAAPGIAFAPAARQPQPQPQPQQQQPQQQQPQQQQLMALGRAIDNDAGALSKLKMSAEQMQQVVKFIHNNDGIFESVLLFRPLSLDELHAALLQATPSISVAKEHLKQYCDSQAIFVQQGNLGDKYAKKP